MTNKRVLFLVNSPKEFDFHRLIKKYLHGVDVYSKESMPENTEEYDLIILWSYKKIIPGISGKRNIIIFHSTDLPEGRGWAPIYYTLARGLKYFVISGILPGEHADTGDIVVKARFKIRDDYTAEKLREWDHEICIMLIREILEKFDGQGLKGIKQTGKVSSYPRRKAEDNEISIKSKLYDVINLLRACEKKHPAFFYYNQKKYIMYIKPEKVPVFPRDLKIRFFDSRS